MEKVSFKSVPENYVKEESGAKPNTVRIVSAEDSRYGSLNQRTAKVIQIVNSETGASFERIITDITFWNGEFIISWKHFKPRKKRSDACPSPTGSEANADCPPGQAAASAPKEVF